MYLKNLKVRVVIKKMVKTKVLKLLSLPSEIDIKRFLILESSFHILTIGLFGF